MTDTGIGIPTAMLASVFERFTQVASHDERGLGPGLHISRCIVEAHAGRIDVSSRFGEGSTFNVLLPRRETTV